MSNINSYKLNPAAAREVGAQTYIDQKGAYLGVFTRAEQVVSTKGTQGIEFDFFSKESGTANYITVWTQNAAGEDLSGRKIIDGILACLRLRGIEAADATIKRRNHETRQDENVRTVVFPELMNKPIGVVLVREEYQPTGGGDTKWKSTLACPFEAGTNRLPMELLDNKPAEGLERILASLRDRPLRQQRPAAARQAASTGGGRTAPAGSGFDDMDDDIPF